jgi:hypothetical protein
VDRRHQHAVSVPVGGYVYASTTVSFFQRSIRAEFRWIPSSVSASAPHLAFIVEFGTLPLFLQLARLLLLACLLQGKGSQQSRGTCGHASTKQ